MNILVAGIGNVFLGDDGFGVEVARSLLRREARPGIDVRDLGIRGIDLGYALTSGVDAAILIDATRRGGMPGTVYVIESSAGDRKVQATPSTHAMDPVATLQWARSLGPVCERVYVVGCEPESFGTEDDGIGRMGLSETVAAAVPEAMRAVDDLIARLDVNYVREGECDVVQD